MLTRSSCLSFRRQQASSLNLIILYYAIYGSTQAHKHEQLKNIKTTWKIFKKRKYKSKMLLLLPGYKHQHMNFLSCHKVITGVYDRYTTTSFLLYVTACHHTDLFRQTSIPPPVSGRMYTVVQIHKEYNCWSFNSSKHVFDTWTTHPFNDPLSRTTQVSRYQKGETNLDFTEARDSERPSAWPDASLHLAPDRQPCPHPTTQVF